MDCCRSGSCANDPVRHWAADLIAACSCSSPWLLLACHKHVHLSVGCCRFGSWAHGMVNPSNHQSLSERTSTAEEPAGVSWRVSFEAVRSMSQGCNPDCRSCEQRQPEFQSQLSARCVIRLSARASCNARLQSRHICSDSLTRQTRAAALTGKQSKTGSQLDSMAAEVKQQLPRTVQSHLDSKAPRMWSSEGPVEGARSHLRHRWPPCKACRLQCSRSLHRPACHMGLLDWCSQAALWNVLQFCMVSGQQPMHSAQALRSGGAAGAKETEGQVDGPHDAVYLCHNISNPRLQKNMLYAQCKQVGTANRW